MPRPKYKISNYQLSGLKWYLEVKIGFNILSKFDCRKIAELIQLEMGLSISESTLYRLFLWNNNNHIPYYHTLGILSQYLGYESWQKLEENIEQLLKFQFSFGKLKVTEDINSLLKYNVHSNTLRPLHDFLEQFPKDLDYNYRFVLGQELFSSLKENPNRNIDFFRGFSKLPVVRSAFFEFLADPDFSIPDYEFGLSNYLVAINHENSWEELQDFIFANTLLLRYHFMQRNKSEVIRIGKLIYKEIHIDNDQFESLFIFPRMRYLTYKLLYDDAQDNFNLDDFQQIKKYAFEKFTSGNFEEQRIIIHTFLDSLQVQPDLQLVMMNEFKLHFEDFFYRFPNYFNTLSFSQQIQFLNPNAASIYPNGVL